MENWNYGGTESGCNIKGWFCEDDDIRTELGFRRESGATALREYRCHRSTRAQGRRRYRVPAEHLLWTPTHLPVPRPYHVHACRPDVDKRQHTPHAISAVLSAYLLVITVVGPRTYHTTARLPCGRPVPIGWLARKASRRNTSRTRGARPRSGRRRIDDLVGGRWGGGTEVVSGFLERVNRGNGWAGSWKSETSRSTGTGTHSNRDRWRTRTEARHGLKWALRSRRKNREKPLRRAITLSAAQQYNRRYNCPDTTAVRRQRRIPTRHDTNRANRDSLPSRQCCRGLWPYELLFAPPVDGRGGGCRCRV